MDSLVVIGGMLVFIAPVAGVIALAIFYGKKQGKILAAQAAVVKVKYDKALDELQKDPSNSEKYQKATALGREYYAFGNRHGDPQVQMVIEARLSSDLQSRTAGKSAI